MENYIPIIEITNANFTSTWPVISAAISQSSFIALDCELSGLGNRSKLNHPEIDMRYSNIRKIVQDYSIVSLGVSCFRCQSCSPLTKNCTGEVNCHSYVVQNFNILTLCQSQFTTDTRSAKFLLSHGFDFNKLYSDGVPYDRGEDPKVYKQSTPSIKHIYHLLIKNQKPIILHNGFIDLLYMYQCFYSDLPKNIDTFAADLLDMFPAGIYDTKFISEFHQSFPATYLEFIFKSIQMENCRRSKNGLWHCNFKFLSHPKQIDGLKWHYYSQVLAVDPKESDKAQPPLCESYKYHGWCSQVSTCTASHDVNRMVRELHEVSTGKRKEASNGVAMFSLAQLITMKKQKVEEEQEKIALTSLENGSKSNTIVDTCTSCESAGTPVRCSPNVSCRISEDPNPCLQNRDKSSFKSCTGQSVCDTRVISNGVETEVSHNHIISNTCNELNSSQNIALDELKLEGSANCAGETVVPSDSKSLNGFETLSLANKNDNIVGHSAGMDAFMTGFIFACDIYSLGSLPEITSFKDPKELNLHQMVGKIYLIGKDIPFLVRSSSYHRTSPAHDRIIKILRSS